MNGVTYSQALRQAWPITGNRCPHFSSNASSAAVRLVGVDRGVDRLEVFGDLLVLAPRDVAQACRIRCTMHVWTVVCG